MSGEMHRLNFAVTTSDIQHWEPKRDHQFPNGTDDLIDRLREVMIAAGNWYVKQYPDMFDVEVT